MSDDLVEMARLAQHDERMATGALYGDLADRIEELEAKLAQQDDLVQAAVAAALRQAAGVASYHQDWGDAQSAILNLITEDAQAALDRVVEAERDRAFNAGRKHERDLIYAFAQRMDTEGKAYAEQILAAIRDGGE